MTSLESSRTVRRRIWEILEVARPGDTVSRAFDVFILTLIFLNVVAVIVETVKPVEEEWRSLFHWFEIFSITVFSVEYMLRAWSCVTRPQYVDPVKGRLRFLLKPMQLIDLFAVLPFYLAFFHSDLRFIRVLRLMRIFRVAKLGRYSSSVQLFARVIRHRKEELVITVVVMMLLIVLTSSLIYYAENEAQPDKFPDIPSAMWWSVVTLTTVGYGDVYPITASGKFLASIIAILGIGMAALPTGILGASFVEEIQKQKAERICCPHCGKELE